MPVTDRSGLIATSTPQSDQAYPDGDRPLVSILIAARDEEYTILACLQAIARQMDGETSVEVLIGDDQSADRTRLVVADYIADKPRFRLVDSVVNQAGLVGKANVLAQLARQARGSLLFLPMQTPRFLQTGLPEYVVGLYIG
ncbi:glycosyltransferase [Spirosoma sp. KNUC1025]|uniref:glycosyltransferase n=1 Tax=Spirosoma sp. KNUC1025 TaxID=2894082 RepID=UPI00386421FD|nr:glycosyltransferase [Spirosoma sp. KNUC1025]